MTERTESAQVEQVESEVETTPEPQSPSESRLLDQFKRRCQDAASASLDMGRIGIEYIRVRMALSDSISRDSCTANLRNAWQEQAAEVISTDRVNKLLRQYATYHVLSESTGAGRASGRKGKYPAIRVIEAFTPLVERDVKSRAEVWLLTPGTAEAAKVLWSQALEVAMTGADAANAVSKLLAEHKATEALRLAKLAAENPADQTLAAEARRAQAESDKANAKLAPQEGTSKPKSRLPRGNGIDDIPAFIYDRIASSEEPDDLLESILEGLKGHPALSKRGHRAIDSALVILGRADKAPQASENGQAVAA